MRHYKKGRKLGTDASHTKAMKKSLVQALFTNDRIKTIEARAKEIRPDVDRIITWAKRGDLHSRRLAIAALGDKELVREIFEKVQQGMWADRQGGYTRIMKRPRPKRPSKSPRLKKPSRLKLLPRKKPNNSLFNGNIAIQTPSFGAAFLRYHIKTRGTYCKEASHV